MTEHTGPPQPTRLFAPLAIILAIPLIFAAVFFYTTPVVLETGGQQGIFKCGSPSAPNSDAENVCGVPESVAQKKAIYSGLSGVGLLGLGAVWMLRTRPQEDDGDEYDRPRRTGDDWDEPDHRRRGEGERSRSRRDDDRDERDRPRRDDDDLDEPDGPDRPSRSETLDPAESRSARLHGRRSGSTEDAPRRRREGRDRRSDDDWAADGWR